MWSTRIDINRHPDSTGAVTVELHGDSDWLALDVIPWSSNAFINSEARAQFAAEKFVERLNRILGVPAPDQKPVG